MRAKTRCFRVYSGSLGYNLFSSRLHKEKYIFNIQCMITMLVKLNIWWKRDECAIVGRAVYSEDDADWTTVKVADGHSQGSILELRILELRRANHLTSVFLYTWPHCTIWLLWFKCKNLAHVTHMVTQRYISVYFSVCVCVNVLRMCFNYLIYI